MARVSFQGPMHSFLIIIAELPQPEPDEPEVPEVPASAEPTSTSAVLEEGSAEDSEGGWESQEDTEDEDYQPRRMRGKQH